MYSTTPTISPPKKKTKAMEWDGIEIHVRKMMASVLFVNPKNHEISKLVVWRDQWFGDPSKPCAKKKQTPLFPRAPPFGSSEKSVTTVKCFDCLLICMFFQKTWSLIAEKYHENPKIHLRSHPQGPLEGGPPDVSPTVYVSEFLSFWG